MSTINSSDFVRETTKYSQQDYESDCELMEECIRKAGGPLAPAVLAKFKYPNILYPAETLTILAISRQLQISFSPDNLLEAKLADWLRHNVSDWPGYALKLFDAVGELKCWEGVYTRANLLVIAPPTPTRVHIAGTANRRPQVVERMPHKSLGSTQRRRLRDLLLEKKRFDGNLNSLYTKLARLHAEYDLEQALISWMGYLLMKTAASKEPAQQIRLQSS